MSKIEIIENWSNIMSKNMVYFKSDNHKVRLFLSKENKIKVLLVGDREGFLGELESMMARIRGYYSTTEKMEELKSMLCKRDRDISLTNRWEGLTNRWEYTTRTTEPAATVNCLSTDFY